MSRTTSSDLEVDPPEIRAHARPPGKSIIVADIGVERRIHEVQPNAHTAQLAFAVFQRGGVSELVNRSGGNDQREQDAEESGGIERIAQASANTMYGEQPALREERRNRYSQDHWRQEQVLEYAGDWFDHMRRDDACL
jgi:hypothetical protein